jgi:hypothetical protein
LQVVVPQRSGVEELKGVENQIGDKWSGFRVQNGKFRRVPRPEP